LDHLNDSTSKKGPTTSKHFALISEPQPITSSIITDVRYEILTAMDIQVEVLPQHYIESQPRRPPVESEGTE